MADRLFYATPTGGHPHLGYVLSMRVLDKTCVTFGERLAQDFQFSTAPVQMARTVIANEAIKGRCHLKHRHDGETPCDVTPYHYLAMHDDDLVMESSLEYGNPLDSWHEIMAADPSIGMMGAVYFRERPLLPNVALSHPMDRDVLAHVIAGMPNQPFEVGAIGTGFVLISVAALRAVQEMEEADGSPPLFRFSHDRDATGMIRETGEDYNFCQRLRKAGFKVVADPRFGTVHLKSRGPLRFDRESWEASWQQGHPDFDRQLEEIRSQCTPAMRIVETQRGFLIIDHIAQRDLDGKAWRARMAAKNEKAA